MKIGIMTFWWSEDNYGQLLQCYALQKYLRDAGHDTYLIRYEPKNDYIRTPFWKKVLKAFNPKELIDYFTRLKLRYNILLEQKNNPRNFEDFRNKYINQSEIIYYSYNELKNNPPQAEVYIVGSDQIWNVYTINKTILKAYLLDFCDTSRKRIAYAASFGIEKLDSDYIPIFSTELKKFDYVSVREKSGIKICKECGINAEWVVDPTLLLPENIYRILYQEESIKKVNKPYCLFYFLNNKSDFSVKSVYDWAARKNLELVYISGNFQFDEYKKTFATIPEWLYLIDNAEYVITNSYHCCVFSLLFKKQFGVIPLSEDNIGMNTRLTSLFEQFKISERYLGSDFLVLDKEIDWQVVFEKLLQLRNNCRLLNII